MVQDEFYFFFAMLLIYNYVLYHFPVFKVNPWFTLGKTDGRTEGEVDDYMLSLRRGGGH